MTTILRRMLATAVLVLVASGVAGQDKGAYDRRNVARYIDLFTMLDRDADGSVTWLEAQGNLDFTPRFDDIDIDRDGIVTKSELHRYLEQAHGMPVAAARAEPAPLRGIAVGK